MKTFFLMLLLLATSAFAAVEESCCFCVADPSDRSTTLECQKWLKDNQKRLACTKKSIIPSHSALKFEPGLSCRKVAAYGANHGLSYYYSTVFEFAAKAARLLLPMELSYDGSTCLVFNNVETVESEAVKLSRRYPNIRFQLSGNQNEGLVRYLPIPLIGMKPKELKQSMSKLTVNAEGGLVEMVYDQCSKPRGTCGFASQDFGATNDSNEKFCMHGNELLTQRCCEPKKGGLGKWSIPGADCGV